MIDSAKLTPIRLIFYSLILLASFSSKSALLSLETDNPTVFVGDDIVIDMWIRDLDVDIVSTFDLDISFDNSLVNFSTASFGTFLGDDPFFQDVITSADSINVAELSFLTDGELRSLQSDSNGRFDFVLASFSFGAAMAGLADFNVTADPLFGGVFGEVISTFEVATVVTDYPVDPLQVLIQERPITDVSEPRTIAMVLTFLAFMLVVRKQARSNVI